MDEPTDAAPAPLLERSPDASDREHEHERDDSDASSGGHAAPPDGPVEPDAELCVVCFSRAPDVVLEPCGHANLCEECVSRLVKRRCPSCRARAKRVRTGEVTRAVREVIAERKQRELRVLEDTLQVVFMGPEKVGKKTLVRKLMARFPVPDAEHVEDADDADDADVFSDGTDFSANACIAGSRVRLAVLRRTALVSRRLVMDDVRVLKPDVLVMCCSAHDGATFDAVLAWDKVLRASFQKPRVWAMLTLDDGPDTSLDMRQNAPAAINAIVPADLRPRGHYLCSPGESFSIGFRSLAKDIVSIGSIARDEELAASIALAEAQSLAEHEAAGTVPDQSAADRVIANNGLGSSGSTLHPSRSNSVPARASARSSPTGPQQHSAGSPRNAFSLRSLRGNGRDGTGISLSGLVNWLAGSHDA